MPTAFYAFLFASLCNPEPVPATCHNPQFMSLHLPSAPLAATVLAPFAMLSFAAAQQRYDHGNPTLHEQLMLELVNRARADPAAEAARFGIDLNEGLAPGTITASAKPPLAFHPNLILSARNHSQWMLDTGVFSHTGVGNSTAGERMSAAGYPFAGSFSSGENIGWGGTSGGVEPVSMTLDRHEGLFRSPGHRRGICSEDFSEIGLGILQGRFQGFNALLVTQNFATSDALPDPWLLGVVFNDVDGDGNYDAGEGVSGVTVTPAGGSWDAVTSASGGYAMPCARSGPLDVVFSGGGLATPVTRPIQLTGANIKLDLIIPVSDSPAPEIAVRQPAGANLVDEFNLRRFGAFRRGSRSPAKTFVIRNTGNAPLNLLAVERTGRHARDFIVTLPQTASIAPGSFTTFKVNFKPTSTGNRKATIRILSDDTDENPFEINVTGFGMQP